MTNRSRGDRACAVLLLVCSLAGLARPTSAQVRKLSAPLTRLAGQVTEHWSTRDGSWCVFLANPEVQAPSLYSVSLERREKAIELSASVAGSLAPDGVRISNDGTRVVFTASGDLYAVPIDGREDPVLVAGLSVTGASIGERAHQISADGGRAVFWAQREAEPFELYSVSLDDPASLVRLASARSGAGHIGAFSISPDGGRVVYTTDQDAAGVYELYAAPIDGSSAAQKLGGVLASNRDVGAFQIAPDGTRVVYVADLERNDVFELFSVPVDGSASPVKLSGAMVARGDILADFVLPPGTGRVLYRADQALDERVELFSAPLDGSAPAVRLNGALAASRDVVAFRPTPDGTRVVYVADQDTDTVLALYLVPVDGSSPPIRLEGPPVESADERGLRLGPAGGCAVYAAQVSEDVTELYAVPLAAGAPALRLTGEASWFELSPDGARVVYLTDPEYPGPYELRSVPTDASVAPVLLGRMDLHRFGFETPFSIAPDSGSVLYRSDQEQKGAVDLYRVPIDARAAPVRLSMSLVPGPVVGDAEIVGLGAGGEHAVYAVGSGGLGYFAPDELWSVPLNGPPTPRRLFADPYHEDLSARLDPSGQWVVFLGIHLDGTYQELWTAPVDGSRPAARSSEPAGHPVYDPGNSIRDLAVPEAGPRLAFATHSEVFAGALDGSEPPLSLTGFLEQLADLEIEPGGERVVYSAYDAGRNVTELFSAFTDGSRVPVRLSGALTSGGRVQSFRISPRRERVVYLADQVTEEVYELYSVPIDGSASAVKLSGQLVSGGDVSTPILVAADGARVVYVADAVVDGITGIYSVPLDGSGEPVELYRSLVAGRESILDLRLTPDGRCVTFLAAPDGSGSHELYSADLTGGPARRLSAPLVAGGSVQAGYQLGPAGQRLVYRADQDTDEVFELYSVRCDGRRAPVKLNSALGPQSDVEACFAISPDGTRVVFAADARVDEVVELFAVPIRGGVVPQRLHPPLGADADVEASGPASIAIRPDSRHVLFVADADSDEVFELFESPLPPALRVRARSR